MEHEIVKSVNISDAINIIAQKLEIDLEQALSLFYNSNTAKLLADDNSGLYGQSALYLASLFFNENYTELQQESH